MAISKLMLLASLALSMVSAQSLSFDYVVIGAGTGGCAAAGRLVEQGKSVLLVERGGFPKDMNAIIDKMSLRLAFNQWERNEASYRYMSEADEVGVRYDLLTGKGLGGSTSINANLYSRPSFEEFDSWNISGWGGDDVKPYFKKIENYPIAHENHGVGGPLNILRPTEQTNAANVSALLHTIGWTELSDGNTGTVSPMTLFKSWVIRTNARTRLNSFDAYLTSHLSDGSPLTLFTNTQVVGFEYRDGTSGKVVVAVNLLMEGNRKVQVLVAREVVVSAGVFETPRLLNLAGIGKAADLQALGISVVKDLDAVGDNLIARPLFLLAFTGTVLWPEQNISSAADPLEQQKFMAGEEGFFTYPIAGLWGYGTNTLYADQPDFAFEYSTTSPNYLVPIPTAQSFACLAVKVQSRGTVKLRSTDPHDTPRVTAGIFTDNTDIAGLAACVNTIRAAASTAEGQAVLGQEFMPGAGVTGNDLLGAIKTSSRFSYHAFGTSSMGTDEATSVVSPRLLVHGFENLRIADGSVIPQSITTGPVSTVYVIGERVADFIAEDNREPFDFSQGFNTCFSNDFLVVKDDLLATQAKEVCAKFLLSPVSVSDPNLTCASKRAAAALDACGVTTAFVRPRGFVCDALSSDNTLLENVSCSEPRPVICA